MIKTKTKEFFKKKIKTAVILLIKPFIVPILIISIIFLLVCYITDILYLGDKYKDEIDISKELKYYTDEEYTEEDSKSLLESVGDFLDGIFGVEILGNADWPVEGASKRDVTSFYGYRDVPTNGASSFHSGIDIAASQGTKLIAIMDGKVTRASWGGASGFTITIESDEYSFSYCHCDPNFIVKVGDEVKKKQVIGRVGPKNVYGVAGNPYKDANGNPTNRCYYRTSLSFYSKKRWKDNRSIRNIKVKEEKF